MVVIFVLSPPIKRGNFRRDGPIVFEMLENEQGLLSFSVREYGNENRTSAGETVPNGLSEGGDLFGAGVGRWPGFGSTGLFPK